MDLPYYHGPLSKKDCETLLLRDGADGNFLLRDSESLPGVLCLCVSFNKFVYTYRIFKERPGQYNIQTTEGSRKQIFPNLKELVSRFEKPNQGLVCSLLKPIRRTNPCLRWRRSKLEMDGVYGELEGVPRPLAWHQAHLTPGGGCNRMPSLPAHRLKASSQERRAENSSSVGGGGGGGSDGGSSSSSSDYVEVLP